MPKLFFQFQEQILAFWLYEIVFQNPRVDPDLMIIELYLSGPVKAIRSKILNLSI